MEAKSGGRLCKTPQLEDMVRTGTPVEIFIPKGTHVQNVDGFLAWKNGNASRSDRYGFASLDPQIMFSQDIDVYLGESLVRGDGLDHLQAVLAKHASKWSSQVRILTSRKENITVDFHRAGSLREAVFQDAFHVGQWYRRMVRQYGPVPYQRRHGNSDVRGADRSLCVVIRLDELIIAPFGDRWGFGDYVAIQIFSRKINGLAAHAWVRRVYCELVEHLQAVCGWSSTGEEFEHKSMVMEPDLQEAIGVDPMRMLRGLYWLNFFGSDYCDFIGRERLLSAPAFSVEEAGAGVLLQLHENPNAWNTAEYLATQERVLDHLGRQYFFDRRYPDRETVAPDWWALHPEWFPTGAEPGKLPKQWLLTDRE